MSDTTDCRHIPKEKNRYLTAWLLIFVMILSVAIVVVYNFSAILMLFNKGEITLHSYSKVLETVQDMGDSFVNVQVSDTGDQSEQIYYETQDQVAQFWIGGKEDSIEYIYGKLDSLAFTELGIMQKYKSVDTMLRPLCRESDILTAEIALIKISSRYAISGLTMGTEWSQETDHEKIIIRFYPDDEEFEFCILLKSDADS